MRACDPPTADGCPAQPVGEGQVALLNSSNSTDSNHRIASHQQHRQRRNHSVVVFGTLGMAIHPRLFSRIFLWFVPKASPGY